TQPPPPDIYTLPLPDALPIYVVGQPHRIEDFRGAVANLQHQRPRPTFPLVETMLALLVREAARARHERQRAAHDANQVAVGDVRSEEHTSELQSRENIVCRLL